jgi:hypothetical protein
MHYERLFKDSLSKLQAERRYRVFADPRAPVRTLSAGDLARAGWRGRSPDR